MATLLKDKLQKVLADEIKAFGDEKKYESKYINIQKMNQHISISDILDKLCKLLNVNIYDHFRGVTKMVAYGSESKRLANV